MVLAGLGLAAAAGYFRYLEPRPADTTAARVYRDDPHLVTLVTRRLQDEDTLLWEYPSQPISRLKRICRLPRSG